jgi:hypothetical protein
MSTKGKILLYAILLLCIICLPSCAKVQPQVKSCLEDCQVYGFWSGLWHGFTAVFSWIGSWFSDDIAVYAVNNNGGWYNFGFLLGSGILTGSAGSANRPK